MRRNELKRYKAQKRKISNSIAHWLIASSTSTILFNVVLQSLGVSIKTSSFWGLGTGLAILSIGWVRRWNAGRKLKKQELEKERFFNYLNEYTSSK